MLHVFIEKSIKTIKCNSIVLILRLKSLTVTAWVDVILTIYFASWQHTQKIWPNKQIMYMIKKYVLVTIVSTNKAIIIYLGTDPCRNTEHVAIIYSNRNMPCNVPICF